MFYKNGILKTFNGVEDRYIKSRGVLGAEVPILFIFNSNKIQILLSINKIITYYGHS